MLSKLCSAVTQFMDSISGKIIVMMVLSILPLNILVIAATAQSIDVVQEQARVSMENAANQYMQHLDNRIFSISYYYYDLMENDSDFIRLSRQRGDDAYILSQTNIAQKFRTNIETAQSADGYFYYVEELDDFLLVMPDPFPSGDDISNREIRTELQDHLLAADMSDMSKWNMVKTDHGNWLVQIYESRGFYYGAFISLDSIFDQIRSAIDFPGLQVGADIVKTPDADRSRLSVFSVSDKVGLYLKLSVPRKEILKTLPLFQWLSIILAFAYLPLIPLLFAFLNKHLLHPLNKIRSAILRLKAGDRDYRISAHNYSEDFRTINQSFNEMADNIENLKIENYEKDMERQKMELRNLQLQIRPHFLLNMFKLVYSLAQIREYKSLQKLALYLSNYFRYIFRSGKDLDAFAHEYDLIREYLEISAIRYANCFTVEYQIDKSVLDVNVPPLLIHNFLENIINHALQMGGTIHIKLTAQYKDGFAEFVISDDGAGMSPEVVAHINKREFTAVNGEKIHLGIYNSYQRLQYFYGEQSVLKVDSAIGNGTCFTIRFPVDPKEDEK